MKRIMIAMGTRPEAIKLCPLIKELRSRKRSEVFVLSTGQHREMLDSALQAFGIKPDFDMDVMRTGQTLSDVTARILRRTDEILVAERPEVLVVQGDTTTAFATALAAFHRRVRVAHPRPHPTALEAHPHHRRYPVPVALRHPLHPPYAGSP